MENNYVIVGGQLYHHGVKGMKWGVRKKPKSDARLTLDEKKRALRSANREYNKAFNRANSTRHRAYSLSKNRREAQDAKWEDALNKADAARKAKAEYKAARKAYEAENPNAARVRKAAIIGSAAAATILAGIGVYKAYQYKSGKKSLDLERGRALATKLLASNPKW